jgi:hypothetical protein
MIPHLESGPLSDTPVMGDSLGSGSEKPERLIAYTLKRSSCDLFRASFVDGAPRFHATALLGMAIS